MKRILILFSVAGLLTSCSATRSAFPTESLVRDSGGIRTEVLFYPDSTSGNTQYLRLQLTRTTDSVVIFYLPVRNDDAFAQISIQTPPDRYRKTWTSQPDLMFTLQKDTARFRFGLTGWEEQTWITHDEWRMNRLLIQFNLPASVTDGVFSVGYRMLQFNETPRDQIHLSSLAFRDEFPTGKLNLVIQNRKLVSVSQVKRD